MEIDLSGARGELSDTRRQLDTETARAARAFAKWESDRASLDKAKDALAVALQQIEEAESRSLDLSSSRLELRARARTLRRHSRARGRGDARQRRTACSRGRERRARRRRARARRRARRTRRRAARRRPRPAPRARRRAGRRRGPPACPTSSDPVTASSESARAPSIVASLSARRAGSVVTPVRTFARSAACRSSVHGSMLLLHGAPSAPSASCTPSASSSATRAMPEPSFRFALGQCTIARPVARDHVRASSTRELHPVREDRPRPRHPPGAKHRHVVVAERACAPPPAPPRARPRACAPATRRPSPAPPRRARASRCTRGRTAARTRTRSARPPRPVQSRASRSLSSRLSRVDSRSPFGTPSPASIIALPLTARIPLRTQASITASCARTVPMSRMVVVPAHVISRRPSSALAASDARRARPRAARSATGATRGAACRRPSRETSAWHRCTCACTNPGITAHPRASMTRASATPRRIHVARRPRSAPLVEEDIPLDDAVALRRRSRPFPRGRASARRDPLACSLDRRRPLPSHARVSTRMAAHPRRRRQPDSPQGRHQHPGAPRLRSGRRRRRHRRARCPEQGRGPVRPGPARLRDAEDERLPVLPRRPHERALRDAAGRPDEREERQDPRPLRGPDRRDRRHQQAVRRAGAHRRDRERPAPREPGAHLGRATADGHRGPRGERRDRHRTAARRASPSKPLRRSPPPSRRCSRRSRDDAIGDRAQIASALAAGSRPDVRATSPWRCAGSTWARARSSLAGDLATVPIGAILQMLQVECKTGRPRSSRTARGARSPSRCARAHRSRPVARSRGRVPPRALLRRGGVRDPGTRSTPSSATRAASNGRTGETPSLADAPTPTSDRISSIPRRGRRRARCAAAEAASPPRRRAPPVRPHHGGAAEERARAAVERARLRGAPLAEGVVRVPDRARSDRSRARRSSGCRSRRSSWRGFAAWTSGASSSRGSGASSRSSCATRSRSTPSAIDDLARPERIVLEAIDGDRTVRDIIAASHMSSFDACRILLQFLEARIVRRRQA